LSAVIDILGFKNASEANNRACDLILDMDDEQLYPDMGTLAGVPDTASAGERTEAFTKLFPILLSFGNLYSVNLGNF
jgi:hypothetical protein